MERHEDEKRIFILLLAYGMEYCQAAIKNLESLLPRILPKGYTFKYIIIDNAQQENKVSLSNNNVLISGNNSFSEFSGWQKGLNFLESKLLHAKDDLILFVNDSFHRSYGTKYLDYFPPVNLSNLNNAFIYGYFDDFPKSASLFGYKYKSWLRSNFFITSFSSLPPLLPLTLPHPPASLFSSNIEKFWSDEANISPNFKAYILCWLTGRIDSDFPEYRLKWAKSRPVTPQNIKRFKLKAISILCEHYLGARIENSNISTQDINPMPKTKERHIKDYYEQIKDFYKT